MSRSVGRGEIFGLLGPNGAGKTTAMRILLTLLRPTAGRARVAGLDVLAEPVAVRRRVGWVPQERTADPLLTSRENLLFMAGMYHLPARAARRRAADLLALAGLDGAAGRLARDLSGGMRRRLELAMGLVHVPAVLFLDEPTLGLDVGVRRGLWAYLREIRRSGTTVVLTTHYLDEADALCDRVAIIDHGRIRATGTPAGLKQRVPGGSYLRFMTAGAVVMTTFNACLQGGVELLFDRESGFLIRMLAAPARRLSIVTSRFLHLAAVTGVQGLVILLAAYVMGVRYASGLGGIAACLATGAVFGAGVTALSRALAFSLRSHAQFFPITGFAGLPLTFVSSALVPLALMPGWMQAAARLNPMTYAIDSVRILILDGWRLAPVASAAAVLLAFDACAVALAALALRRGLR